MTGPLVSVLILTYNSGSVIGDCVAALSGPGYDPERLEIVVADNASADDSLDVAIATNPAVVAIRNPSNDGFAAGVRIAAAAAHGRYLLLLNPDAVISAATVYELAAAMESKGAAIGAPLVIQGDGLRTIGAGRTPTTWRMFLHASGLSRLASRVPALEGHYLFAGSVGSVPRRVDWVTGGCLMVSAATWREQDGLSTRWFMYAEDIEFCLRVGAAGGTVMLFPELSATHAVGGSSSSVDGRVNPAWIVNLYDLYCTAIARSRLSCTVWKLAVCAGFAGRLAVYSLRPGGHETPQQERYRAYLSALWHSRPDFGERRTAPAGVAAAPLR